MKKEYIAIGKNVNNAIEQGLFEIGKNREDVDIKILETGGLFKKAKVVLIYEEQEIIEPEEKEISAETIESEVLPVEENSEIVKENEQNTDLTTSNKTEQDEKEVNNNQEESVNEEKATIEEKTVKIVDKTRIINSVTEFLKGIMDKMSIVGSISVIETGNDLNFDISGENVGKLIGYRGETLQAIQFLLGSLKSAGEGRIRVYLDIEGYKNKRAETIIELANKMADKAEEIERNVHLDPMSANERRIVHSALQNRTLVETESMGEGPKRHVVIKFKR